MTELAVAGAWRNENVVPEGNEVVDVVLVAHVGYVLPANCNWTCEFGRNCEGFELLNASTMTSGTLVVPIFGPEMLYRMPTTAKTSTTAIRPIAIVLAVVLFILLPVLH